ncbi:MAG: winged helix-turn-helix transcriptional regulator [Firmicutes bacterium]|nr:winged helix-turn-helix transcriptional regulator [Bacillota bacterium]
MVDSVFNLSEERALDPVVFLSDRLKALADPTRLRLLKLLSVDTFCVCELGELLEIHQPAVSQHLQKLRQAGWIYAQKRGQWVYYRVAAEALPLLRNMLGAWWQAPLEETPGMEAVAERLRSRDPLQACSPKPLQPRERRRR